MREKKGGALQKLKKRLSHSFGRLCKYHDDEEFSFQPESSQSSFKNVCLVASTCSNYSWFAVVERNLNRFAMIIQISFRKSSCA